MCEYKFERGIGIVDAVNKIRTDPQAALWFVQQIKSSDIARIFVREWMYNMGGEEAVTDD